MKKYLPIIILGLIIATSGCDNINPFKKKVDHALLEQQRQDSIRHAEEKAIAMELKKKQQDEELRLEEQRKIDDAARLKALNKYHLVVGSFKVPGNATRYHAKISSQGHDSQILMAKNGFHLVTMKSFDNFRTAANELRNLSRAGEYEVWLYVQN